MKRFFDIAVSLFLLLILMPFLVLIALFVVMDLNGGPFYKQERIGQWGRPFMIYKFRTMKPGSDTDQRITVGEKDPRITRTGYFLRRTKVDELPQLVNVLLGNMSLVGPRPEVSEYVDLYTEEQRKILSMRPGITDYASIEYADESRQLAQYDDPEEAYIEIIMPDKIKLNLVYLEKQSFMTDLSILCRTAKRLFLKDQGNV